MRLLNVGIAALMVTLTGPAIAETATTFTARSGESVQAWRGTFEVPEDRSDPQSRRITLAYLRFKATGPEAGPPIVYLAGGPGGSGIETARGPRFPLFMALRAHGDVIAFDQRGTGQSTELPPCVSGEVVPAERSVSDGELTEIYRRAVRECRRFWTGAGVAIGGYTTKESVADLSALRRHLGAETLRLWGISYGTHLALAALTAIS